MKEHTIAIDAAVAPTCTETGLTEGKHCSVCKKVLVEQEVVPTLEHAWDEGKVTTPATCTQKGVMTYTCTRCGDTRTEPIAMKGHTIAIDAAVAPTCTETGLTEGKHCSSCGEVFVAQEVLQTIPHNYVNGVCTMCGKPEEGVATEGLVFTLSDDGTYYSVTDYTGSAKEVIIPSVHQGLPVTSIESFAFYNCTSLTSITIPDSVTSIGSWAFRGCDSLTSVYITDIAAWCAIDFGDAYANPLDSAHNLYLNGELVTDLVIPDSVTSIGKYAFCGCESLTSITIPISVTSIGYEAFLSCYDLTNITIPDSVTSIEARAFAHCSSLLSITIPDGVTSIGGGAFVGCDSLTSISVSVGNPVYHSAGNCLIETENNLLVVGCKNSIIPNDGSVYFIGDSAFAYCGSLTNITIPDVVLDIGASAFEGCSGLTSITIPDGVMFIGSSAFSDCSGLTSITIPDSVISIGWRAFQGCSGLTSVTIGDGVTSIGNWAFGYCDSLTSVTIGDGVTSIGDGAFLYCDSLTSITIPDSVTSIGDSAFYRCTNLTNITIPDSVTSIGSSAFEGCSNLTSITIPDSVTSIGAWAFAWCDSLTSVTFANPNGWSRGSYTLSAEDLSDPATAARYLRSTYRHYTWTRT